MTDDLGIPPKSRSLLTPPDEIAVRLSVLIGSKFPLTGKTRTDGSNARKAVSLVLAKCKLPLACDSSNFTILPPKGKGVPRILREYIDTYIITTGTSYNLQVWNRNPAANSIQVEYQTGDHLYAKDVRFVFLRVNPTTHILESIVILSPEYIELHFGKFGKPTIKHQMIISPRVRAAILKRSPALIFETDTLRTKAYTNAMGSLAPDTIHADPVAGNLLTLESLRDNVAVPLLNAKLAPGSTKNRGQELEMRVARMLGYTIDGDERLVGGYPDIRHQALEVKVQDSPTIDLGKHSPEFEERVPNCLDLCTNDIRYMIALTEPASGTIAGIVLCPGAALGNYFSYVADTSYKSQRSIPMSFFERFKGKAVFNPA